MMARDAVARAPSQCLSAHVMERQNDHKNTTHFSETMMAADDNNAMPPQPLVA
jgi:hypothetical protein